ncbi:hypothetical protein CK503_04255 [Aliifodinibius salipaludis]|uniref:DUF2911 domain-containing protein n=1 Tax=Fodinibius salipaludis TaxID=2032627 RepID=A0A2A2GD33_9BACT|nr:DUF2911 domain-containing protein [Aliifodinibius salipaludis]PAU94692.1 hypothetical protein CK503_04255 [Aliifodinibius salipaludis]
MKLPFYFFREVIPSFLIGLFLLTGCGESQPQEPDRERRKSPIAIAQTTHEPSNTYIKIVYGQPYKNGRQIFGELVPYNEVWRTGANEATELTTTRDVTFADKLLEAGTYALFSIPKENGNWTIILNSKLGQWGAFDYNSAHDVLRVNVPSQYTEKVTEAFTIRFADIQEDSTNIIMEWDQTEVRIPVEFSN